MSVAYFVALPADDEQWLNPEFVGGEQGHTVDMHVDGHLFRGVALKECFTYHVPVPPELLNSLPTRVVVKPEEGGFLSDFGIAPWGGWNLVSQAFVDIVEQLEPGVHQFLPISETIDHNGRVVEKRFFLMNILQKFNAVYVERSSVVFRERKVAELNFVVRTMLLVAPQVLVLKKALVSGHHLWHGTTEDIYQVFFSEALHDTVLEAGLSPLEFFRAEEV